MPCAFARSGFSLPRVPMVKQKGRALGRGGETSPSDADLFLRTHKGSREACSRTRQNWCESWTDCLCWNMGTKCLLGRMHKLMKIQGFTGSRFLINIRFHVTLLPLNKCTYSFVYKEREVSLGGVDINRLRQGSPCTAWSEISHEAQEEDQRRHFPSPEERWLNALRKGVFACSVH